MVRPVLILGGVAVALGLGGCVSGPLPPGTLVGVRPPPPPVYAPPPPPERCYWRDGWYGPERVCRRVYY